MRDRKSKFADVTGQPAGPGQDEEATEAGVADVAIAEPEARPDDPAEQTVDSPELSDWRKRILSDIRLTREQALAIQRVHRRDTSRATQAWCDQQLSVLIARLTQVLQVNS